MEFVKGKTAKSHFLLVTTHCQAHKIIPDIEESDLRVKQAIAVQTIRQNSCFIIVKPRIGTPLLFKVTVCHYYIRLKVFF